MTVPTHVAILIPVCPSGMREAGPVDEARWTGN